MEENHNPNHFSKEQKIGFIFMLVFAILAVGLGLLQMRNTVYGPFVARVSKGDPILNDEQAQLKAVDTDHDNLNDYDELYLYNTSPYLPDTDSDGLPDKTEIDQGTNPLCAEGQACSTEGELAVSSTASVLITSPLQANLNTFRNDIDNLVNPTSTVAVPSSPDQSLDANDLNEIMNNIPALRQMLLASGKFKQEDIAKISDDKLRALVKEIAGKQGVNLSTTTKF